MDKHVAVLMGGWSAEREVSLRSGQGLRRCARAARLPGHPHRRRPRHRRRCCSTRQARRGAQRAARPAGRGRHAAGPAGDPRHPLQPFRRAGLGAGHAEGRRQGRLRAPPACRCRKAWWSSRFEAAKSHLLPPPYVIKPIAEGSSVGVFIVTEEHAHPPQELTREDWTYRRTGHRRKIHCRQGVDLRGHGRRGARRDRDRADGTVLRLRGEIRAGRLQAPAAGANFTLCLPRGPKTSAGGASARSAAAA